MIWRIMTACFLAATTCGCSFFQPWQKATGGDETWLLLEYLAIVVPVVSLFWWR